jgi:predicted DNA-binding protein (MmcQ/YjbR family)
VTEGEDEARDAEYESRIRRICLTFPETEEIFMWGGPLFRVRRRRYAVFNGSTLGPCCLHLVTAMEDRPALQQDARFRISNHHGDRGWMALDLDSRAVDWGEIEELIETAYRQVAGRQLVGLLDDRRASPD